MNRLLYKTKKNWNHFCILIVILVVSVYNRKKSWSFIWLKKISSPIKRYPNQFFCMWIVMFVASLSIRRNISSFIWLDKWISWTKKLTPVLHVNCDVCGFTSRTKQYLWLHLGKLMNSKIKKPTPFLYVDCAVCSFTFYSKECLKNHLTHMDKLWS